MMNRAPGNSVRIAIMTSIPLISGSLRSMRVTSGLCSRKTLDRLASVRRLRHHNHSRLAIDDHRNPFAKEGMVVNTENPDVRVHNRLVELVAASSRQLAQK